MDSRPNPEFMGIVQLGGMNRKVYVKPARPLAEQFTDFMEAMIDSTAGQGTILFQLRQLSFAEITAGISEKGYCYMRAELYAREGDRYAALQTLDTVMTVSGVDVTKPMFRAANQLLSIYLKVYLARSPGEGPRYTYNELFQIDSIEKQSMPLYTATTYKDGIYRTYTSFRNQQPDAAVIPEIQGKYIMYISELNKKGKPQKVDHKDIYAFVHNGKTYIATDYGYYALRKEGNDFYFKGIAGYVFFGLIGGLMASSNTDVMEMMIDHVNGGFLQLKPEEKTNEK
jgi:hypothetical protein